MKRFTKTYNKLKMLHKYCHKIKKSDMSIPLSNLLNSLVVGLSSNVYRWSRSLTLEKQTNILVMKL